jgi:hypothetical protein
MAGDLNFTTSTEEVWGASALPDPLAAFFKEIFIKNHLVDIQPTEVVPTWRNGRSGVDEIQKRLDRVFASDDTLHASARYRIVGGISFYFRSCSCFVPTGHEILVSCSSVQIQSSMVT